MKSIIALIIGISFGLISYSQQQVLSGQVVDKNKNGIPFAVVQLKDKNEGTYCDENGKYTLKVHADINAKMIVYCMGYVQQEMMLKELVQTPVVVLQDASVQLSEVTVHYKKDKTKEGVLGRKDLSNVIHIREPYTDAHHKKRYNVRTKTYSTNANEQAIYLKASNSKKGILKNIFVYVSNNIGVPSEKFRVHVYEQDPVTRMPAKDITDSNLVVHGNKGNEWVQIDISAKQIPVYKGLFVSVEWIVGADSNPNEVYKGPSIGLTDGYWKAGAITVLKHSFDNGWTVSSTLTDNRILNLMVYATYTYN